MIVLWGSHVACGEVDVVFLIEFLQSKGRDCHINTGVHGKLNANEEFEFDWEKDGSDLYRQDIVSAGPTKNKVSIHEITREKLPVYHAGVDVIDAFCFSWSKKLTEGELDQICEEYLEKEKVRSGSVQPDEKDQSDEDSAEMIFKKQYPALFSAHFDADKSDLQFTEELKVSIGVYRGYLKGQLRHGPGVMTAHNGDRYEGQWADGKLNGAGRYIWANGDVYDGNWKDNLKNGHGVKTWADGSFSDGNYKDNLKNGNGRYTWAGG